MRIPPRIKRALILGILLLIVASTGRILFKKMTDKMPRYPYFQSIFVTLVAVPFYFLAMLILKRRAISRLDKRLMSLTSDPNCTVNSSIRLTPETRQAVLIAASKAGSISSSSSITSMQRYSESPAFPKYKLMIMGFLDALASIMMVFGGNRTSGALQALLIQGVIPITMVLSFIFLKERYVWQQYIGAALVLEGVFTVFAPQLFTMNSQTVGPIIMFASCIPTAISSVFKEHNMKRALISVIYMQSFVALFQLFSSFLLFPLNLIPGFGQLSIKEVPENLWDGMKCYVGINSAADDDCFLAFLPLTGYTITNIGYNIVSLYVIKELSSAIMYIQNAVRLPLVTIAFHLTFIMGATAEPWNSNSWFLFGGLGIIIVGLVMYMWKSMKTLESLTQEPPPPVGSVDAINPSEINPLLSSQGSLRNIPTATLPGGAPNLHNISTLLPDEVVWDSDMSMPVQIHSDQPQRKEAYPLQSSV